MKINLIQGSKEWLDYRYDKIGASDAPVIMGVSPWKDKIKLHEEKISRNAENIDNHWTTRGKDLEQDALEKYNELNFSFLGPEVHESDKFGWMIASYDGISVDLKKAVEIKCPGKVDHALALEGKVPKKYYPQLQHQIAVLGLDSIDYFSYVDDSNHVTINVRRDESYIDQMVEEEMKFWMGVQNFIAPVEEKKVETVVDSVGEDLVNQLIETMNQKKELEEKEKFLREAILGRVGHKSCDLGRLEIREIERKGTINYKEIPELKGVDLERYRTSNSIYIKINIKD